MNVLRFISVTLSGLLLLLASPSAGRLHGASPWVDADLLKDAVGLGHEWDEWTPQQLEGWKHMENFGAFYPWSNWIYHLDHGWLYPVGDNLGSIWFYSLKLNNNWIWTSHNHFDFFYVYKSSGFYFYDKDSKGEYFHDFQNGEWLLWYQLPGIFPVDLSWQFTAPPPGMVLVPQGSFEMGGLKAGEPFTDQDADGKHDAGEPYEDTNGNGQYDARQGYEDEYPQHAVNLSPFYVHQFEVTNQLWNQVAQWATTRPDKPEAQRANYTYQFDSLEYIDAGLVAAAYRKLETAVNNYKANPSERNRSEYDKKLEAFNTVLAARDEKAAVIEAHRLTNPSYPVNYVSWSDAAKWCNAYSEMAGRTPVYYVDRGLAGVYRTSKRDSIVELENGYVKWYADGYRLPTEAEWEKAARGGLEDKLYTTGDTIDSTMEHIKVTTGQTNVGSYPPNGYGLYDMGGNLQEWCWDWKEDYEEVRGSFTLQVPSRKLKASLAMEDLASLPSKEAIVEGLSAVMLETSLGGHVQAALQDSRLVFTLQDPAVDEYVYVSGLDRNAISILGLREMESSLPLAIDAAATPSGLWRTPATFTVVITALESGRTMDYAVTAQSPEPGKVLTLYTIVSQLNDGLEEAGLKGVLKAGISGDRILLSLETGQAPSSFAITITPGSPMATVIGFNDGQQSLVNADTSTFVARNPVSPARAKVDPHGPVAGDRRVFRGGSWNFNAFHSRASSRSSHQTYLPTKNISFRPVIGLHRDDRP